MVGGLLSLLGCWWHGGNGRGGIGAIFRVMETSGRETDHTSGFPDVENGGGEVVVMVDEPCKRISGSEAGDEDEALTHNDRGIEGPRTHRSCVSTPKKWGIHKYLVVGGAVGHAGARC